VHFFENAIARGMAGRHEILNQNYNDRSGPGTILPVLTCAISQTAALRALQPLGLLTWRRMSFTLGVTALSLKSATDGFVDCHRRQSIQLSAGLIPSDSTPDEESEGQFTGIGFFAEMREMRLDEIQTEVEDSVGADCK
jgi:hypothetical protein